MPRYLTTAYRRAVLVPSHWGPPPEYPDDNLPPAYHEAVETAVSWPDKNPDIPSPRLPPELTDRILDFLHDDFRTLGTCSLVSRRWLPTTRYHRFISVKLKNGRHSDAFEQVLIRSSATASFVQSISTAHNDMRTTDSWAELQPIDMGFYVDNFSTLSRILGKLESLITLSLSAGDLQYTPSFSNIRDLHLEYCTLPTFKSLVSWLCSLRGLESVHISECRIRTAIDPPEFTLCEGQRTLKKLVLQRNEFSSDAVVQALLERGVALESLMMLPVSSFDLPKWSQVLTTVGITVKQLGAAVLYDLRENSLDIYQKLLVPCVELHTLHFFSPALLAIAYFDSDPPLSMAPALLCGCKLPKLERVIISLSLHEKQFIREKDWRTVIPLLRSSEFPRLREIIFQVYSAPGDVENQTFVTDVTRELSDLASQGMLSFNFSKEVTVRGIFKTM